MIWLDSQRHGGGRVFGAALLMPSNVSITPSDSARNFGVIFDSSLTMSDHISSVSKSCFLSIRDLRRIRSTLDFTTAKTIATSLIHTKVDYCNSLFLNLPRSQLDRLQLVLNSAARAVSRTPHFTHISPVLESLHWLKVDQRIHYKILSITYKTLQFGSTPPLLGLSSSQFHSKLKTHLFHKSYPLQSVSRTDVTSLALWPGFRTLISPSFS